jgi:hypothetical protein
VGKAKKEELRMVRVGRNNYRREEKKTKADE